MYVLAEQDKKPLFEAYSDIKASGDSRLKVYHSLKTSYEQVERRLHIEQANKGEILVDKDYLILQQTFTYYAGKVTEI